MSPSVACARSALKPVQESWSRNPRPGAPPAPYSGPVWPVHLGIKNVTYPGATGGSQMARGPGPEGHSLMHPTAAQQTGHPARPPCCAGTLSHEAQLPRPCPHQAPDHSTSDTGQLSLATVQWQKAFPGDYFKTGRGNPCAGRSPQIPNGGCLRPQGGPRSPFPLGSLSRVQCSGHRALCRDHTSPAPARPSQTPRVPGTPRTLQPAYLIHQQLVPKSKTHVGE